MAKIQSINELLYREVVYESEVRAMTDDFSVVDIVENYTSRKNGDNDGKDE